MFLRNNLQFIRNLNILVSFNILDNLGELDVPQCAIHVLVLPDILTYIDTT